MVLEFKNSSSCRSLSIKLSCDFKPSTSKESNDSLSKPKVLNVASLNSLNLAP
ncbi:hypothetical protein D3C86_2131890 [compost metagenome]